MTNAQRCVALLLIAAGCADPAATERLAIDDVFGAGAGGKGDGDLLPRQALAASETALIDRRGVGDSAWTGNKTPVAIAPGFGDALDAFDATGESYQGDVSFVNWESVVGEGCAQFHADQFGFLSHPTNVAEANDRGFGLVGVSNNHTRDCGDTASPTKTAAAMAAVAADRPMAWNGVASADGDPRDPSILSAELKGRTVRVAFASLHLGRQTCPQANCKDDVDEVLSRLGDADADLRVLALHVLEFGDAWEEVAEVGSAFVRDHGGDVVFGSGPHVWKPPLVVEKQDGSGEKGVIFTSLGNFIHPWLSGQSKNLIGRALFDPDTLALRQIQAVTVATAGGSASFGGTAASAVGSYGGQDIPWTDFTDTAAGATLRGAYASIPDATP